MKRKWTKEEVSAWCEETKAITYANPEDANLMVRKPNSLGWTLNWANPKSYLVIAAVFVCAWIMACLLA